ncbi:MAG: hypothetical protein JWL78_1, partial [Chloroflexi bacterium]|nr:hypothetical protein [Chloroflexota bacterium]
WAAAGAAADAEIAADLALAAGTLDEADRFAAIADEAASIAATAAVEAIRASEEP